MLRALIALVVTCGQTALHPPAPAALPSPDPPEPTEPAAECKFERAVHCAAEAAATCPATKPAVDPNPAFGGAAGRYSAAETRKARATDPRACCYVEFVAGVCL